MSKTNPGLPKIPGTSEYQHNPNIYGSIQISDDEFNIVRSRFLKRKEEEERQRVGIDFSPHIERGFVGEKIVDRPDEEDRIKRQLVQEEMDSK